MFFLRHLLHLLMLDWWFFVLFSNPFLFPNFSSHYHLHHILLLLFPDASKALCKRTVMWLTSVDTCHTCPIQTCERWRTLYTFTPTNTCPPSLSHTKTFSYEHARRQEVCTCGHTCAHGQASKRSSFTDWRVHFRKKNKSKSKTKKFANQS